MKVRITDKKHGAKPVDVPEAVVLAGMAIHNARMRDVTNVCMAALLFCKAEAEANTPPIRPGFSARFKVALDAKHPLMRAATRLIGNASKRIAKGKRT